MFGPLTYSIFAASSTFASQWPLLFLEATTLEAPCLNVLLFPAVLGRFEVGPDVTLKPCSIILSSVQASMLQRQHAPGADLF